MATLLVVGTYPMKTERGKEKVVVCSIQTGSIVVDHPSGQTTYYNLEAAGKIYHVRMTESYIGEKTVTKSYDGEKTTTKTTCKEETTSGAQGTLISFYFPNEDGIPQKGDILVPK